MVAVDELCILYLVFEHAKKQTSKSTLRLSNCLMSGTTVYGSYDIVGLLYPKSEYVAECYDAWMHIRCCAS